MIVAALGAVHAWTYRNEVGGDGISYLDLADAFAVGNWHLAFNRLWSPLYPALIALAFRVARPSPYWESTTAHLVNFLIFLAALGAFEFLLSQLIRYRHHLEAHVPSMIGTLPDWAIRLAGYAVFAHSSLELSAFPDLTPDVCVSVIVYLAAGLLLGIASGSGGRLAFPLLGGVLGIGYLVKAPMFPLALVFLAVAAVVTCRRGVSVRALLPLLAGLCAFVVLASVLAFAFFRIYGQVTLGESGRLNYAIHVNGLPYIHWRGEVPGSGNPVHPTRRILSSPPLYEFATPIGGTYPPWLDPAYWYEGVRIHFDAAGEAQALVRSAGVLFVRLLLLQTVFAVMIFLLVYREGGGRRFFRNLASYGVIVVPAIVGVGMFAPIHLDPRFVFAFVVVLWLALFAAVPWPASNTEPRALKGLLAAMIALLIASTLTNPDTLSYWQVRALGREILHDGNPHLQWTVAQGLQEMGVQRGDPVAVIGFSFNAYWARLLGSRIVAEMPECRSARYRGNTCPTGQPDGVAAFLAADQAMRERIFNAFARTGARVVVISVNDPLRLPDWRRIDDTDYYAYILRR